VALVIGWAGYTAPLQQTIDGATKLIEQPQSEAFLLVLRLVFVLLPIVLLAFALYFALRFPLTPKLHQRLNNLLLRQRLNEPVDENEKRELTKVLLG
jgi:oligogalacturonide transporter